MGNKVSRFISGEVTLEEVNSPPNVVDPTTRVLSSPLPYEPEVVVPEGGSLYRTVEARVKEELRSGGDWVWLNCRLTRQELRASEAITYAKKFSVVLRETCSFSYGDVAHLVVGNHNLAHSLCFGIWTVGGVASLGDPNLEAATISKQLKLTSAKVVVCTQETCSTVTEAVALLRKEAGPGGGDTVERIFCLGQEEIGEAEDLLAALAQADAGGRPEPHRAADKGRSIMEEPIVIFWSSGTTGIPKGITHSHVSTLECFAYLCSAMVRRSEVTNTTTFFHVGGFMSTLFGLLKGCCVNHMVGRAFDIDVLVDTIIEKRPAMVSMGPHHYVSLSEHKRLDTLDPALLDSIKVLMPLGGSVSPICEVNLKKRFRNLKAVVNVYGQTETGAVSGGLAIKHLGRIVPRVEIKFLHQETDEPVGPGEEGEMCVRNDLQRMLGYWGRPKETAETIMPDGFVRTGDVGKYNEKGEMYFVDRVKELIKYHNIHVSPTELEEILQEHPAVNEVLVFGRPDLHAMELTTAVVVRNNGFEGVQETELVDFLAARVGEQKRLHGGVMFADSIPRNSVGKLLRREMRRWAQEKYDTEKKKKKKKETKMGK